MPQLLTSVRRPKVVLAEGSAERALAEALMERHGITGVQALEFEHEGNTRFGDNIEAIQPHIAAGEVTSVGILADNEEAPSEMFRDIKEQLFNAEGVNPPLPDDAWTTEEGDPSLGIAMLPSEGAPGTVETLIWEALRAAYTDSADAAEEFISGRPTGQEEQPLGTREKARFSAALAATCEYDPSCMVHWMWQSNKGYRDLLDHGCFRDLVRFLAEL